MNKKLVVYFSATGTTKKVAQMIADKQGADLYEITSSTPYTSADLNWNDENSRSSMEMKAISSRPEIAGKISNIREYDTFYLGFPIWWGVAPRIINTFLESYNFSGKKIITFATSGGSSIGNSTNELKVSAPQAAFINGKVITPSEVDDFIGGIK